jgi:hypothetical protein
VVLGGEDVAARPAHLGTQRHQGLDQDGGLHGHVQRPRYPCPAQWSGFGVLAAQRHETGHLMLRQIDLLAAKFGQRKIRHLEFGDS